MKALVAGATGFIGRALCATLDRPAVLARDPERARDALGAAIEPFAWHAEQGPPPSESLRDVDVVFNLAGENISAGRWTDARKEKIRRSRIDGTLHLVEAIARAPSRPRVLVSASAVGCYGDRGDETLDESSAPGNDFLARMCVEWEAEALRAREAGLRVVLVRTGIVLGKGGMLPRILVPFRMGLGGRLGSGRQWVPWIHIDDEVGVLRHAAERVDLSGPVNAASPNPATNAELTRALARVLRRPAFLRVPAMGLKAALGAELASVLLGSQRATPGVLASTGYRFRFTDLEAALRDAIARCT